jgi:hypothetical protein
MHDLASLDLDETLPDPLPIERWDERRWSYMDRSGPENEPAPAVEPNEIRWGRRPQALVELGAAEATRRAQASRPARDWRDGTRRRSGRSGRRGRRCAGRRATRPATRGSGLDQAVGPDSPLAPTGAHARELHAAGGSYAAAAPKVIAAQAAIESKFCKADGYRGRAPVRMGSKAIAMI